MKYDEIEFKGKFIFINNYVRKEEKLKMEEVHTKYRKEYYNKQKKEIKI